MTTVDRSWRKSVAWLLAGAAAALLLAWAFPRAYPFFPGDWTVARGEATAIALERLRDLGELPDDPFVVTRLDDDPICGVPLFDPVRGYWSLRTERLRIVYRIAPEARTVCVLSIAPAGKEPA